MACQGQTHLGHTAATQSSQASHQTIVAATAALLDGRLLWRATLVLHLNASILEDNLWQRKAKDIVGSLDAAM